jgi:hypothetical protein
MGVGSLAQCPLICLDGHGNEMWRRPSKYSGVRYSTIYGAVSVLRAAFTDTVDAKTGQTLDSREMP